MTLRALAPLLGRLLRPDVALFHHFQTGPWGGSNQFFQALRTELRRRGLRVAANVAGPSTRACVLNAFAFDAGALRRVRWPGCRIVHRVDGPVSVYRGTGPEVDRQVADLNRTFADATVFQSRYSMDAHRAMGIELHDPRVIVNAVDPAIFHSAGRTTWDGERPLRLVATSWSDNPNKGGATLRALEQMMDRRRFTLTFVGRSRERLDHATVVPPLRSAPLAAVLREHDVYVAPSLHDPCSNALLEALACGLPVAYARSGGHPELVGDAGVGFDSAEEALVAVESIASDLEHYRQAIRLRSLSEVTDDYLVVMGLLAR